MSKQRRFPLEAYADLLKAAGEAGSTEVQAWLLQYRREHYHADEWEAWEQRKLDLELGFAEPRLQELRRTFRVISNSDGICITGLRKQEKVYEIPAAVEGKPVVAVNAEAFYPISPMPYLSRSFPDAGGLKPINVQPASDGKPPCPELGNTVLFGRRAEKKNTAEQAIAWQVIRREEDRVLLNCKETVARLPYHPELAEVTWENCALRQWLNQVFLPLAFTPGERACICSTAISTPGNAQFGTSGGADTEDRIFLPSAEELAAWFPDAAQRATGIWLWTRSPGFDGNFAVTVKPDGNFTRMGSFVDAEDYGVLPALWLRLASNR